MQYTLKRADRKAILLCKNNIVIEVNNEFLNLAKYTRDELIGTSLNEITNMLRLESQIHIKDIDKEYSGYIFTKEYKPIEITIKYKFLEVRCIKEYIFIEKNNSNIEDNFIFAEQIYSANESGYAIFSYPDWILLKANQKHLDLYEAPFNKLENSIGKKEKELVTDLIKKEKDEIWNEVVKNHNIYNFKEFKCKYSKRGVTYWDTLIMPVHIKSKPQFIFQVIKEVTERVLNKKKNEEQAEIIKQEKEKLEKILEHISDEVIIFDKNADYTNLNLKARKNNLFSNLESKNSEKVFTLAKHFDINGKKISDKDSPSRRVINGEKITDYRLTVKQGKKVIHKEINGNPIYDSEGNIIAGMLICRNITDRIKAEQNLLIKVQYESINKIIENLELGCGRISYPDFRITYINNKISNVLSQIGSTLEKSESICGSNMLHILELDNGEIDKIKNNIRESIAKKESSYFHFKKLVILGKNRFYKIMFQPLVGLNNKIVELILVTIDITEEIQAKKQIEKNLKMQEEIFVNISHELKTPLNVIFTTAQLFELYLKKGSFNENKVNNGIDIIRQNCYRLAKLIGNIVDISKIESGYFNLNISNENIVVIVEDIVQSVSGYVKTKGLSIIFDTNIEEKVIACDTNKIERIMLNLLSNAIKFSNPGGRIFVNVIDNGETVNIIVEDNGIGIETKYLKNIFERFHQVDKSLSRNAEGSGIGLSLVKSIVELKGGKIKVESKVCKGSKFIIELPARIVENPVDISKNVPMNGKNEMINIEFSDIYSE